MSSHRSTVSPSPNLQLPQLSRSPGTECSPPPSYLIVTRSVREPGDSRSSQLRRADAHRPPSAVLCPICNQMSDYTRSRPFSTSSRPPSTSACSIFVKDATSKVIKKRTRPHSATQEPERIRQTCHVVAHYPKGSLTWSKRLQVLGSESALAGSTPASFMIPPRHSLGLGPKLLLSFQAQSSGTFNYLVAEAHRLCINPRCAGSNTESRASLMPIIAVAAWPVAATNRGIGGIPPASRPRVSQHFLQLRLHDAHQCHL
jgi:hypothetical protein